MLRRKLLAKTKALILILKWEEYIPINKLSIAINTIINKHVGNKELFVTILEALNRKKDFLDDFLKNNHLNIVTLTNMEDGLTKTKNVIDAKAYWTHTLSSCKDQKTLNFDDLLPIPIKENKQSENNTNLYNKRSRYEKSDYEEEDNLVNSDTKKPRL